MECTIETKRLRLRDAVMSDLQAYHELQSLPESQEYNTLGIPENIEVTRSILQTEVDNNNKEDRNYTLAIELRETGEFIGMFALNLSHPRYKSAEVWYKIHVNHWGNGYATEAFDAVIDFAFKELDLHRIGAGCHVENIGSIRVIEKVGMTREGRCRKILPIRGEWHDNFEYAILKEDRY